MDHNNSTKLAPWLGYRPFQYVMFIPTLVDLTRLN